MPKISVRRKQIESKVTEPNWPGINRVADDQQRDYAMRKKWRSRLRSIGIRRRQEEGSPAGDQRKEKATINEEEQMQDGSTTGFAGKGRVTDMEGEETPDMETGG